MDRLGRAQGRADVATFRTGGAGGGGASGDGGEGRILERVTVMVRAEGLTKVLDAGDATPGHDGGADGL